MRALGRGALGVVVAAAALCVYVVVLAFLQAVWFRCFGAALFFDEAIWWSESGSWPTLLALLGGLLLVVSVFLWVYEGPVRRKQTPRARAGT